MQVEMVVTERSRVTSDPDAEKTIKVTEVYDPDLRTQPHTIRFVFTDREQVEDLIASCLAVAFDFLTEAEVQALR